MNRPLMGLASLLMAFAGFYQEFSPYDDDYAPLDNAQQVAPRQEPLGCLVNQTPAAGGQDAQQPQEAAAAIFYMSEEAAKATGKTVWIHFMDTDCPPCKEVDKLHKDPRVIAWANENFANVLMCWCDETLHDRIRAYGVRSFPQDCFVYPDGQMKPPRPSPRTVEETLEMLEQGNERSILLRTESDLDSVVKIRIPLRNVPEGQLVATGSGVVVERNGRQLVVTNHHVVEDGDRSRLEVYSRGVKYEARVVAEDSVMDLAVLDAGKLTDNPAETSQVESWADVSVCYGSGYGGLKTPHRHRLKPLEWAGIGKGRWSWVRFQNANCDGDSGGPIFDEDGNVVGVMWGHGVEANTTMGTCGQPFLEIIDKAAAMQEVPTRRYYRGKRSYNRWGRLGGGPVFLPRLRFAPQ